MDDVDDVMDVDPVPKPQNLAAPSSLEHEEIPMIISLGRFLSSSGRPFVSGFQVEDTTVTLWYSDRFGLIKSKTFDLVAEPHYFVLMVAAIHFAKDRNFGILPLFSSNSKQNIFLNGRTLAVPHAVDADGVDIGSVQFRVGLTPGKAAEPIPGAIGQGGFALPVVPLDVSNPKDEDNLTAKLTWQSPRRHEQVSILRIRKALSAAQGGQEYLKHIIEVKCSSILNMDDPELQLPRVLMTGTDVIPDDKLYQLEILVTRTYLPLERIKDSSELRQVFSGVISGM